MSISIGKVKWYGGFNHKKNTENKFGFVEDADGMDVFLHERDWKEASNPQEHQLVVYTLEKKNGKYAAQNARLFRLEESGHLSLLQSLLLKAAFSQTAQSIKGQLVKKLASGFSEYSEERLQQLVALIGKVPLCTLLAKESNWDKNLNALIARGLVIPLQDLALDLLPAGFFTGNSSRVADYLLSLDADEASQKAQTMSSRMPGELVCFTLLARFLKPDHILAHSLARYINAIYSGQSIMPDYLKQFIGTHIKPTGADAISEDTTDLLQACVVVFGKKSFCKLLAKRDCWEQNLSTLVQRGIVIPLRDLSLDFLPHSYLSENSSQVADYLLSLDTDSARQKAQELLALLPDDLVCFALLARLVQLDAKSLESLDQFVSALYSSKQLMPDYLKQYINSHIKPNGGVIKDEVVGPTFCRYQFKYYLHARDLKCVSLYNQTPSLQEHADTFILSEIFSLVLAGTSLDNLYPVFLGRLWEGISSGKIDIARDKGLILNLFPSCITMPLGLSCEAVHWPKHNKYLCRGRECSQPQVIPNICKHYLDFTIYDWFFYYGIRYGDDGNPSKHDFPIKLAGYFNRLYEIFDVIHCRECSSLMLPDMRYARVEHTVIENGEYVKKDMAPAYRLTIFKCPNESCIEHGQGHYINHCLGFDCYQLIDDRDSKTKCDSGLYICNGCGSCCAEHAKSNPVGLCPDCGSGLQLFETSEFNMTRNRLNRLVKCSNQHCGFHIPTENLNKRFYLPSCEPLIHATPSRSKQQSSSDNFPFW